MKKIVVLVTALLLIAGCTATPGGTAPATTPAATPVKSEFKNLQVFPRDIPREQLIQAMRGIARGLGTRCDYCHVVTATEPKQQFDFAADTKPTKQMARVMLRMNMEINDTWIPRTQAAEAAAEGTTHTAEAHAGEASGEPELHVTCWTCHRGKTEPEAPPPPPQEGARPAS